MSFFDAFGAVAKVIGLTSDVAEVVSTVSTVVGTGVDIVGKQQVARANEEASIYKARVLRQNAEIARRAAKDAIARGGVDATDALARGKREAEDSLTRAALDTADTLERAELSASDVVRRAEVRARDALERGEFEDLQRSLATRQLIGQQAVALAGNGVSLTSQSALDFFRTTETLGALDVDMIRRNAQREASSILSDASRAAFELQTNAGREAFVISENARRFASTREENARREAFVLRRNAEREAEALRTQGLNFEADAVLAEMQAKSADTAGDISSIASAVSGAGAVADKWYNFAKGGGLGAPTITTSGSQ